MGRRPIDCWCQTCQRQVTVSEVRDGSHREHNFNPEEKAALEAVSQYLETFSESELE